MSSPLAGKKAKQIGDLMIAVHQSVSHRNRLSILSNLIAKAIDRHVPSGKMLRCLDVGCGDMRLAEMLGEALPQTLWVCMDVYDLPAHLKGQKRWEKYCTFDGKTFPFANREFDVVVFSDVLHHAAENAPLLLAEAARTSRFVIVKDHFEYSWWSRRWLWIMDSVGNWSYGISLPKKYFRKDQFKQLVSGLGLITCELKVGIDLYNHIPVLRTLLHKQWQFLAVLRSAS